MSTLKVNTIQNTSAAHSSTPEEIAQGRAKAWCNFDQSGTQSIRDSFNVSSLTDQGVGFTDVNYTNAMSNTNYCAVMYNNGYDQDILINSFGNDFTGGMLLETGKIKVSSYNGTSFHDSKLFQVVVFGDQ